MSTSGMQLHRKYHLAVFRLLVCLLSAITGSSCLKDVVSVIPQAATIGDTVTLQCRYDLEGEPLYTLKWYKGTREFFRYTPKEHPSTQVFPVQGIVVDLAKSNQNSVVMRNLLPEHTGTYKCEVSSDAPNFYTKSVHGYMYVINVPQGKPEIQIEKESLEIGYTLRGNCSAPLSFPPMNITWYLNKKLVNASFMTHVAGSPAMMAASAAAILSAEMSGSPSSAMAAIPSSSIVVPTTEVPLRRRPLVTIAGLELEIDGATFMAGKARIKCVAKVFNLYQADVEKVLDEERPRPRPSSVLGTRDSSTGSRTVHGIFVISTAIIVSVFLR